MTTFSDPARKAHHTSVVLQCPFHGENFIMILRHEDVHRKAKAWQTFSCDAPFRVPVPSEEDMLSVRLFPLATDPPAHTDCRAIAEPFFHHAKDPAMIAQVESLIHDMITRALSRELIEILHEFALPMRSATNHLPLRMVAL